MDSNSFKSIVLDDLEHIIYDRPTYGKGYRSEVDKNITVFDRLSDLLSYTFAKKYVLIYQNDSLTHGCDFTETKKENTDVLAKILSQNTDKLFMIVDHGRFDHFTLKQYSNCQIWPRKYFAPFYSWTHYGSRDDSIIQPHRRHWFCSVLGRSDAFRTQMFNWFVDHGLETNNKISYLAYGVETRDTDINNDQQDNFIATGGQSKYKDLIPYNNFESKAQIPVDNDGRIKKTMPLYDCLFNIVVETYISNGNAMHTEKSLNAILYGHIPVILGGPGTMKKLQDMGMIIPDYIPWSMWDDLPIDQVNYSSIGIMQRQLVKFFAENKIEDIAADWYPYAIRNFNRFNDLAKTCAREEREICRWILIATHNVSNPKYQRLY